MSEYVPRSCRVGAARASDCTCFQSGNASQEPPKNMFNICNRSRLGGHCLRNRLEATFILDAFCMKSGNCK